jgi:hypothetical protein
MLSMEDVPVVSVPVVASEAWLDDPVPAPSAEQGPPRFKSEEEEPEEDEIEASEPVFFAATGPVTSSISVIGPPAAISEVEREEEVADMPAWPRFEEMAEQPAHAPLPREYTSEFGSGVRSQAAHQPGESPSPGSASLFPEASEDSQPDLDVPAFMRRSKF